MIKCTLPKEENGCPDDLEICCCECQKKKTCPVPCDGYKDVEKCSNAVSDQDEETGLVMLKKEAADIIKSVADLTVQKKKIEDQEKQMRGKLLAAMEKHGIKSFENELVKFVYVPASSRTTIDSAKLKKELPNVAAKYSKSSNVSASVKITVKE